MRFGRRKRDSATTPTAGAPVTEAAADAGGTGLSIACVTDRSPEQTAAAIAPLRAVASEIVIGLDAALEADRAAYEAIADRVVITPTGPVEWNLAAVHAAATEPWVLRIDTDEVVSPALVAELPALLAKPEVRQYAFARRWLSPDATGWYDEHPWSPDWQVRLVRRATAQFPETVHAPVPFDAPREYVRADAPIYHAIAPLLSARERRRKMLGYEIVVRRGPSTLRQPSAIAYEPERHATRPPVAVPFADRGAIDAFLARFPEAPLAAGAAARPANAVAGDADPSPEAAPSTPSPAAPATAWAAPAAPAPDGPAEARIALLDPPPHFASGDVSTVIARFTNDSDETWESGAAAGDRGHAVAYHWHLPDGTVEEGIRTLLPAPVQPGETVTLPIQVLGASARGPATLAVQILNEQVRWLPGEGRGGTTIHPARPIPTSRELLHPGTPEIPKILHRVWLGSNPLPDDYQAYGETWAKHHPDWELRLWTEADAPYPAGSENARSLSERSDLVRYAVLKEFGGVYVDTDVECLRPIDDLIVGRTAFAGYEVPGRVCGAVMGGLPGHPAFEELVDLAEMTTGEGHFPESVTTFVTYVLEAHPDVTLFDPSRFYPELWDDQPNLGDEPPYTDHHWGQSWNPAIQAAKAAEGS